MTKNIFLFLSLLFCFAGDLQARKQKTSKPEKTAAVPSKNGLFDVSQEEDDWFFFVPDSLLGREFLASVRFTGTPASVGKYGGESVTQQTVYFERLEKDKMLLRSRILMNTSDSIDAIDRAVRISNVDPIIGSFRIESRRGNKSKIKVSPFFLEDNNALGINNRYRQQYGLQSPVRDASFIESIKTFPTNTEVRLVKTWTSSGTAVAAGARTGKVTIGLNISFILLPKTPMLARLFDPRVGYFSDRFERYTDAQQHVESKRFITRWRLEPKDSADAARLARGELVEPKKPIVYYIDPATPKQWRPYLIQGVNDWQKAFEKAGFKNAIRAEEWPDTIESMSMEDARYSVIRYLASPIPNAYGPQIHDPRSGEILESHICWYHNVMQLVHHWYMIQAGNLDEAARKMKFDEELMGQLIRFVSSHEVGHTLGLRHNFGSSSLVPVDSLRSRSFVECYGHTPSIMDYARFNYVAQPEDSISRNGIFPRIGDYDDWAIEWGYRPMFGAYDSDSDHWELEKITSERLKNNPRLWFGDGETNATHDPRCLTEDLGDDAVKASHYGILNLQRMMKQLPEWTYESNDIYGKNLSDMYGEVRSQFYRYCGHVTSQIGGTLADYKAPDQTGVTYSYNSRADQQRAVDFLHREVLTEPRWLIAPKWMMRFLPNPDRSVQVIGRSVVRNLYSSALLTRLNPNWTAEDYLSYLTRLLFEGSMPSDASGRGYAQAMQREAVTSLIALVAPGALSEPYAAALSQLQRIRRICQNRKGDAHSESLVFAIDKALSVK
ncbi:MAG: zinc-dependent metalloprotease [Alloprevotella sp.]